MDLTLVGGKISRLSAKIRRSRKTYRRMINNLIAFVNIHRRIGRQAQYESDITDRPNASLERSQGWSPRIFCGRFLTEAQAASGPVPNSLDLDSASQGCWLKAHSKAESSA
jgi:hypothetical protein